MENQIVDASGEYIRGLKFPALSGTGPGVTGSRDRMEIFFHELQGAVGTLRNWRQMPQKDRLDFVASLSKNNGPDGTKEEREAQEKFRRNALLGVLFRELYEPGGDILVAQAAFDSFREPKTQRK